MSEDAESIQPLTIRDVLNMVGRTLEIVGMQLPEAADLVHCELNAGLKENGLTHQLVNRSGSVVVVDCRRRQRESQESAK